MLFNSIEFIYFFVLVYALYLVLAHRAQNLLLLAASYFFYGSWDWRFLSLIWISTLVDYYCGRRIGEAQDERVKKRFLVLSLVSNLGILFAFKYFNFFASSFADMISVVGFQADWVTLKIVLPVGISFYTFQTISYSVDVYRGEIKPARTLVDFALYVAFFPQLVAGPIERASRLLPQMENRRTISLQQIREGAWLILIGYFMKVVMADNLGQIADETFEDPSAAIWLEIPLSVLAFAFQIYGDFAGYSNIARGVSKLMGFNIMLNFQMPYFAVNPSDFWRRWHISLSSWLRDYLYIPLGGNRFGNWITCRNLMLTMLLGGLWHGAAWHFVAWGAYHGLLLIGHRQLEPLLKMLRPKGRMSGFVWHWICVGCFFCFTLFGWLLFRVDNLGDVGVFVSRALIPMRDAGGALVVNGKVCMLTMLCFVTPVLLLDLAQEWKKDVLVVFRWHPLLRSAVYLGLFAGIIMFGMLEDREFIYFQF